MMILPQRITKENCEKARGLFKLGGNINVCVLGLGYIGLPTAAILAASGCHVLGVRRDAKMIDQLNRGETGIFEPGLAEIVRNAVAAGRLSADNRPGEADVFIIAVPTPFTDGHRPDLSFVKAATEAVSSYLKPGDLVILESTSPVRTTEKVRDNLVKLRPDLLGEGEDKIYIAYSPERVLPGRILEELINNDRIIGGIDEEAATRAADFYRIFVRGNIRETNARTAELCKLVENAFRDVNIAFANEVAYVAEEYEVDPWQLIEYANLHPRVNILQPGPGVGGHCIAVDPWFLVTDLPDHTEVMRAARAVNDSRPNHVATQVADAVRDIDNPTIVCLGLSFKPDIDDLRESPAVEVLTRLAEKNIGQILCVEPFVRHLPAELNEYDNVQLIEDVTEAIRQGDVVALLVHHTAFKSIPRDLLRNKKIIDTRGFFRA
jgi:UDP-N-acetyl-D-mannosaminuronic acid dehydrogenase